MADFWIRRCFCREDWVLHKVVRHMSSPSWCLTVERTSKRTINQVPSLSSKVGPGRCRIASILSRKRSTSAGRLAATSQSLRKVFHDGTRFRGFFWLVLVGGADGRKDASRDGRFEKAVSTAASRSGSKGIGSGAVVEQSSRVTLSSPCARSEVLGFRAGKSSRFSHSASEIGVASGTGTPEKGEEQATSKMEEAKENSARRS